MDESIAGFLQDALRESQILIRAEIDGVEIRIYVRPRDGRRAREIVREIVEGARRSELKFCVDSCSACVKSGGEV